MKVLIVDDDALVRDGLKIFLELDKSFEVSGTASNGQEAFDLCSRDNPDIVLMDIRMPVMDGVLGTKLIKSSYPHIKVVILTTFKDDEYIIEAMRSGAEGYILKNQPVDSIIESLKAVAKGSIVLEKDVANTISSLLASEKKVQVPDGIDISEREFQILKLVGSGYSNREIGEKLYLSEGTVRNYVSGLLEKTNLRDRTQLAIFYIKNYE